jgi:hypothetical protein
VLAHNYNQNRTNFREAEFCVAFLRERILPETAKFCQAKIIAAQPEKYSAQI